MGLACGGRLAQAVITDPPYGVAYVGGTAEAMTIQNDNLSDADLAALLSAAFDAALCNQELGGAWFTWAPAGPTFGVFARVLAERGLWRQTLIWVKDRLVLGRGDYHYRHEPFFYGWKPGAAHREPPDRTQDSVWECPRPRTNAEHPTMKPVPLIERAIRNSTAGGDLVLDLFGGSGTTLIAAAQTGRVAALVELDPRYADVIRRRWTRWALATGEDPGPGRLD